MTDRPSEHLQAVIDVLKEAVTEIEGGVATTRNHYGEYMNLMMRFGDDKGQRKVMARALIMAGANEKGVTDALRLVI